MRIILFCLLFMGVTGAFAQEVHPMRAPENAASQLEDLKEATKAAAAKSPSKNKSKMHVEARPEINRYLVISTDDFLRIVIGKPTREAYLACLDKGLARLAPLAQTTFERQQIADYFEDILEIVGVGSSDGRLIAFVYTPDKGPAASTEQAAQ